MSTATLISSTHDAMELAIESNLLSLLHCQGHVLGRVVDVHIIDLGILLLRHHGCSAILKDADANARVLVCSLQEIATTSEA